MAELPRCAVCRVAIQAGQNVRFRTDGRVAHVDCPDVMCPVCTRRILPGDPIRRNGEEMLHGNCWLKRHRAMAGGSGASPWTVFFERIRPAGDPAHYREAVLATAEVLAEARAIRRYASVVCAGTRVLRGEYARLT
jgi:hypothetical protein